MIDVPVALLYEDQSVYSVMHGLSQMGGRQDASSCLRWGKELLHNQPQYPSNQTTAVYQNDTAIVQKLMLGCLVGPEDSLTAHARNTPTSRTRARAD